MNTTEKKHLEGIPSIVKKIGIKNLTLIFFAIIIIGAVLFKLSSSRLGNITDTEKIGTLKMIDTAFKAHLQNNETLPLPDDMVTIKILDQVIGYQGYVGSHVSKDISFLANKKIDSKSFSYFLDPSKTKYQLMTWVAKTTKNQLLKTGEQYIIVGKYEKMEPYFLGSELGMFFEPFTHVAIQEVLKDKVRDISNNLYPSIQRYSSDKVVETNPRILIETASGLSLKFREKQDTSKMNNLVGRRKFDEGSGNIVHDSSKYKNDGVITGNGLTWTEKNGKKGLQFNGNGRVEIQDSDSLDLTDNFILVIEYEAVGTQEQGALISKEGGENDIYGAYYVTLKDGVRYVINKVENKRLANTDELHNTLVLQYKENKLSYMNNYQSVLVNYTLPGASKLETKLLLGRRGSSNFPFFKGIIYSIRIYNNNSISSNK